MEQSLTDAVLEYQKTRKDWTELSKRIYLFAYSFPKKWTNWDEDRCGDFFLAFQPRIHGLVKRYRPKYQFETYLNNSMRWYVKTFTEKLAYKNHHDSYAIDEFTNQALEVAESLQKYFGSKPMSEREEVDEESCPFPLDTEGRLADIGLRRRILYVALHRAADIDDNRICCLARLTGVSCEWLLKKAGESRRITSENAKKREILKQRRNECWYLHHRAASRAVVETQSGQNQIWLRKSETWRARHRKAMQNIDQLSVTPSHADIGRMVGSPTGTVSSGLFFLRRVWNHMEQTGRPPEYIQAQEETTELDPKAAGR